VNASTGGRTVLITGASSGFGALTARLLARRGHTVYAGMRDLAGRNKAAAAELETYAHEHAVAAVAVELDVTDQDSTDRAVQRVLAETDGLDVLVHNAGHMALGPSEAFTTQEIAHLFDVNVLGTQRLNRSALPHLRGRGRGLLVWVGSSSTRGGTPPFIGPYFAAKAAMDSLAVTYAAELIKFGIETTIVVPGAFTSGTQHFENSGRPRDTERAAAYEPLYGQLQHEIPARLAGMEPADADVADVASAIADVVDLPDGRRPFRVHIDPMNDGAEVVSAVADRIRVEFLRRAGLEELLGASPSL